MDSKGYRNISFQEYSRLLRSDLYRLEGKAGCGVFFRHLLLGEGFKYNFWMRTCAYVGGSTRLRPILFPFVKFFLRRIRYRLGISVPPETRIGSGFYIGHFGGIVVNKDAIIGKNCNISQGVTLGQSSRGKNEGVPTLGDNVYIGPGAKVIGKIVIGNNVAIGANSVVTHDVPDDSVVVGIPGRVISQAGAAGYILHTDYEA